MLAKYRNGGYQVTLMKDGTKIREKLSNDPIEYPEHMDLKITDWCDAGCAWCHEKSTKQGKHGNAKAILALLNGLPYGTEIAVGGGDPLSHPEFEYLVKSMSFDLGLVPSVTVNGKHFDRHRQVLETLTSQKALFGVGFSYQGKMPDWDYPHLVIHLITGIHQPEFLFEEDRRKFLLLGYKQFGRGQDLFSLHEQGILDTIAKWYRYLFHVAEQHDLSFDNLAVEQLKPQRLFADEAEFVQRYMGDEGSFGMYVDGVTQKYALSSYSKERFDWTDIQTMHAHIRKEYCGN